MAETLLNTDMSRQAIEFIPVNRRSSGPDFPAKLQLYDESLMGDAENSGEQLHITPEPTSSLLAIDPETNLFVAAAPYGLIIDHMDNVRRAIKNYAQAVSVPTMEDRSQASSKYTPRRMIINIRARHVTFFSFSQRERHLLVAVDHPSPTLYAYRVGTIFQESCVHSHVFDLGQFCNVQENIKICQPHPIQGFLCAIVFGNGRLWLVNLLSQERRATEAHAIEHVAGRTASGNGSSGEGELSRLLLENVSCLTWNNAAAKPGTREAVLMIAGHMDGTVTVIAPEGNVVAELPKPDNLPNGFHGEK